MYICHFIRPKGPEDSIGTGPGFTAIRSFRPSLPTGPAPLPQQIKPVNEEPDEEFRNRELPRDHDNQDDDADLSDEPLDSQEESEENVPSRGVSNLGSVAKTSAIIGPTVQPVQYRPLSVSGNPSGRGSIIPTAPAPAPVQYRPTAKPSKPRKPIEEPFKQQVKPTKSANPSQPYDARGKKPVAQVSLKTRLRQHSLRLQRLRDSFFLHSVCHYLINQGISLSLMRFA